MAREPEAPQTPQQIADALELWLASYPNAVLTEDGRILFDLRETKYTLSIQYGRCTLHLWSADRNLTRRVIAAAARGQALRLSTMKFGQTKPSTLELLGDKDLRTPTTRDATRTRYLKLLERVLGLLFDPWRPDAFRTSADLEKSFGPAYARGLLVTGNNAGGQAWAVIAVNEDESPATIDGILTFGILWLEACRANGKRHVLGLRLIVPTGRATLTLSRLAWLANTSQWQLFEFNQRDATLTLRDAADQGNLTTHLVHAPNPITAQTRFAYSQAQVMALIPEAYKAVVEPRLRTATELAFLIHGLEFARIRIRASAESFNRVEQITFGAGPAETALTPETEPALRDLVARLLERRSATGDKRDPLFRLQPERWLEGELRRHLPLLDPHLNPTEIHAQVPAFAASDRGMLDLLAVSTEGRLAVLELKAEEDPQLALQGLDYWVRVRWHHQQPPEARTGLGEFQRHGYFPGLRLLPEPPTLYLVAPALRIHPATEVVLRHLSPQVPWTLVALDERWRHQIRVTWRKRHTD